MQRNRTHLRLVRAAGVLAMGLTAATVGCQPREPDPALRADTLRGQGVGKAVAFGDLPDPVQLAFKREHPRGSVKDTAVQVTPVGLTMYRIVYEADGLPAEAVYSADGVNIPPEEAHLATRPPPPAPVASPTNPPANITAPPPGER